MRGNQGRPDELANLLLAAPIGHAIDSTFKAVSERAVSERPRVGWLPLDVARNWRGKMAHAVVMQVKLPQDGSPNDAQRMLEEIVIPLAKSQAGFMNGTWLHDGKGSGMGVIVFATA